MNRRKAVGSMMLATAAAPRMTEAAEWNNPFAREWRDSFLLHWRVTKDYTLAVFDAMPADGFGLKPVPEQRTFGEQMLHLGSANVAYMTQFGTKHQAPVAPKNPDRAAVRAYLAATFDYVENILRTIAEADLMRKDMKLREKAHSGTDLFLRAYMHTAHHRGQAVVYLRVKGIVPPMWAFEPTAG